MREVLERALLLGVIILSIPFCARAVAEEIQSLGKSGEVEIGSDELQLDAESAIVIDSLTGEILYEKNAHVRRFPARYYEDTDGAAGDRSRWS